jgi:hypothetical protein
MSPFVPPEKPKMLEPLSLETITGEFSEEYEAWVLQDAKSQQYVVIPHARYQGRAPVHFFMSQHDAMRVLQELLDVNKALAAHHVVPVKVKLLKPAGA